MSTVVRVRHDGSWGGTVVNANAQVNGGARPGHRRYNGDTIEVDDVEGIKLVALAICERVEAEPPVDDE